jgi:hypothetical protein
MARVWYLPVLMLAACSTTRYGEKITQSRFEFPSYSIDAPKGEWGISRIDKASEEIEFACERSWGTAGVVQVTTLTVRKKLIETTEEKEGKPFKAEEDQIDPRFSEDLFAKGYLQFQQKYAEETGRTTNKWSIRNARTGVETVGGKNVYFLRFSSDYKEPSGRKGESVIYAYFPPDWRTRRAFFTFYFDDMWRVDQVFGSDFSGVSHDMSALEPLIASFTLR